MSEQDWQDIARRAIASRGDFERRYNDLPGRIRHLLKHLDPRAKTMRNTENELKEFGEDEVALLRAMLKQLQSFPLNHDFPRNRHESRYRGKCKNRNHLISSEELKRFDRRNPGL